MRLFLSYSRKDGEFVSRLAADLERAGVDVWLDKHDLAMTDEDRWRPSIVQAIRESSAFVIVLSPNSVRSGQVERELTIAAELGRRIIPIIHRPCDLPDGFQFELAGVQRIDFAEQAHDVALGQLLRRVGAPAATASGSEGGDTPGGDGHDDTAGGHPRPGTAWWTDERRRRAIAIAGGALLAIAAIVVVVVATTSDGDGGASTETTTDDPGSTGTGGETTVDDATTTVDEAETTSTPATTTTIASSTSGPGTGGADDALELIDTLVAAYITRDWDTVRAINRGQASWTDEELERQYAPMVRLFSETFPGSEADGNWVFDGALIVWDRVDHEVTNVVCIEWTVDPETGQLDAVPFAGTDGRTERGFQGWIEEPDMPATASEYCLRD